MFKPKSFGSSDLVVLVAFECIAVPICIAAGEAFVSENYGRAIFGWLVGIPLSVVGFTAPFWMSWLSDPLRASIRRQSLRWWPAAILLAFLYVTGPVIFATASWQLTATISALVAAAIAVTVFALQGYFTPSVTVATAIAPTAARGGGTYLDIAHLLDFGVNSATFWMLDRLIEESEAPELRERLKDTPANAHEARHWFVGFVRQELGQGDRLSSFLNIMHSAEIEADHHLKATPKDQWPEGIDPITFRQHKISDEQFRRTVIFLRNQKREVKERLVQGRWPLIERVRERSNNGG